MDHRKPKILVVHSPQGGGGKTTIATNIALLSAAQGVKTLLVDMAMFGNINSTLRIRQKPGYGLAGIFTLLELKLKDNELTQEIIEIASASIERNIDKTNLDVLITAHPAKMELLNERNIRSVIQVFNELNYNLIVIDTSSEISVKNLLLMERADMVIMPILQDISCGWKLLVFKEIAESFKLSKAKLVTVINRSNKFNGFNNKEFQIELGYENIGVIPDYKRAYQFYINTGKTILSKFNRPAYTKFLDLTKKVLLYMNLLEAR